MAFRITADQLAILAKLLLEVEPAIANLLKDIFSHVGIDPGELQAQTAGSLDHTRVFLEAEANRINTQLIVAENNKAKSGESVEEHLFDASTDPTQPVLPFDPVVEEANIAKAKKPKGDK